ncbi:MAG: DUF1007 family protein [Pararhizobium sp.]
MLRFWLMTGAILLAFGTLAEAHPHVFVDGHVTLDADSGKLVAVTNVWTFDAPFSAFATQGLDKNRDGRLSAAELKPLAATNMESLKDYHFFTYVGTGGPPVDLDPPRDYLLTLAKHRQTLHVTLPLKTPLALDDALKVEVFDPEYFVAYAFPTAGAVSIDGPAGGCKAAYQPPRPLDAAMVAKLAAVPASQHDLPPALRDAAAGIAHVFVVHCR